MKYAVHLFLLAACLISVTSHVVHTALGTLQGWTGRSRDGREYSAFTKIPFAKPPVGSLRFKNPVPFGKWKGVLNATEDLPICLQFDALNITGSGFNITGSEDCLYMNIYVPKGVSKKLPVLFYIHGGGFRMGHPGGRQMARFIMDEDVILVATTYRLTFFGFLSLEDSSIPGNFGLKDQALALKWVKDNIHNFGGDAERIVIFGESAGGACTHHLLLSPLTKDLISGAVSSSGVIGVWGMARRGHVRNASLELASTVGCSGEGDDLLACLQNVDSEGWKEQLKKRLSVGNMQFKPCVEPEAPGALIPTNPLTSTPQAPWITSFTSGEYLLFYSAHQAGPSKSSQNFTFLLENFARGLDIKPSPKSSEIIKRIEAKYSEEANEIEARLKLSHMSMDVSFTYAALDALNRQPGTKYFYVFEHRGAISMIDFVGSSKLKVEDACHADELIYLFDLSPRVNNSVLNDVDLKVSKEYINLLTNFAYYQNPTPNGSNAEWKPWTKNEVLRITSKGNFKGEPKYYEKLDDTYKFWKDIVPLTW